MEYLLNKGANINYQNKKNGMTALLSACHWGYEKVVEFLLKKGANPNVGSDVIGFCTTPLLSAIFK
jgi:ankyrin repeat protein